MDDSKIIDTLINVACLVFGFLLSTTKEWFDKRSEKVETRKSLRCLVSLELKTALSSTEIFWQQVLQKEKRWRTEDRGIDSNKLGKTIAELPFPMIVTTVWQTSISHLPDAYTDTEIKELWGLYNDLFLLANLHQHFNASLIEANSVSVAPVPGSGIFQGVLRHMAFSDRTGDNMDIFRNTIEGLIAKQHSDSAVINARKKIA